MTEDPNPFDSADSAAAILGFIFSEFGADGLKELLCLVDADRESLERDAAELSVVGLAKPAQIVSEAAKQTKPAIERWNPYPEHDHANHISWREGHLRAKATAVINPEAAYKIDQPVRNRTHSSKLRAHHRPAIGNYR